jgi:hypothetical protein
VADELPARAESDEGGYQPAEGGGA